MSFFDLTPAQRDRVSMHEMLGHALYTALECQGMLQALIDDTQASLDAWILEGSDPSNEVPVGILHATATQDA